ncbi:MAG: glycosyltransferase [Thermoanaerobaculia bacterium]
MRRILLLTLNHDPLGHMGETHVGGQAKYVLEVAKNLTLRGWSIVIYTIGGRDYPECITITRNCVLVRIERTSAKPYAYDVDAYEAIQLGEKILLDAVERGFGFEVVYACFWISGLAARPLASFFNIPLVFSFCQLGIFKAQSDGVDTLAKRIEHETEICRAAYAIIATNRDEIEAIRVSYAVPRHKIHFIPRGVDLQIFFS